MINVAKLSVEDLLEAPLKDLITLHDKLTHAIERKKASDKIDLAKQLHQLAAESGFTLADLAAMPIKTKKAGKAPKVKGEPKFQNPDNRTQTWTGKGKQPDWFKALINSGKTKDDLKI